MACGIFVPPPGIKRVPPAGEAWSPNHWISREATYVSFYTGLAGCINNNKQEHLRLIKSIMDLLHLELSPPV